MFLPCLSWIQTNRKGTACFILFFRNYGGFIIMETRVAVMSIIAQNNATVDQLNRILHDYAEYIIGRMGIPYRTRGINLICIAVDAPQDTISSLSGKIGNLEGLSVKTVYSSVKPE